MERKITGAIFILVSAILYSANSISITNLAFDDNESALRIAQESLGSSLIIFSALSFIIGVIYLVLSEIKRK